jgi:DNA-binding transcriptional LysR family regulator
VLRALQQKSIDVGLILTPADLVANGLGITFIQRSATIERPDGIRYVEFPDCVPHVDSAIAWRADARHGSIALFAETAEREAALLSAQLPSMPDAAVPCDAGYAVNA